MRLDRKMIQELNRLPLTVPRSRRALSVLQNHEHYERPFVVSPPRDVSVVPTNAASFTVSATGSGSLSYQWRRNGTNISNANSPIYNLTVTQTGDSGSVFDCVISSEFGTITTTGAVLTVAVTGAPVIVVQPSNVSVASGATATFTVTATGDAPLSYQWRLNGSNIVGATGSSYSRSSVPRTATGDAYDVLVSNAKGSIRSNPATLFVNEAPTVTDSPDDQTVTAGTTVAFSVTAQGPGNLSFQWYQNGVAMSKKTTSVLVLSSVTTAMNGNTYYCRVSNAYGNVNSSTATLYVNSVPTPAASPTSGQYIGNGSSSGPIVSLGFRPRLILISGVNNLLFHASTNGDGSYNLIMPSGPTIVTNGISVSSTGFQITTNSSQLNFSGSAYNYLACP